MICNALRTGDGPLVFADQIAAVATSDFQQAAALRDEGEEAEAQGPRLGPGHVLAGHSRNGHQKNYKFQTKAKCSRKNNASK